MENNSVDRIRVKKKIKKTINIIEYVILFTVIFVNIILVFESVHNPSKTPSIFGKKAFVIISGSMIPEIQIGDVVIVKDTETVNINDVIAFRKDSSVIVHRLVNKMNVKGTIMYQTKGDNNNIADSELVAPKDVEGVMIGKIPFIGKIIMWIYNNLSVFIVIVILLIVMRYIIHKFLFKESNE